MAVFGPAAPMGIHWICRFAVPRYGHPHGYTASWNTATRCGEPGGA